MSRSTELRKHTDTNHRVAMTLDRWQYQFSTVQSYENSFRELFCEGESFQSIVQQWSDHGQVAALDLMGYGVPLNNLGIKHGLGVALTDARPITMQDRHGDAIHVIGGDVLRRSTWKAITQWLEDRNLEDPHFRLVLFRPIGGMESIPHDPKILFSLLQRLWALMSVEGSELFASIPDETESLVKAWVEKLNATPGITARIQTDKMILENAKNTMILQASSPGVAIRLTKKADAPETLPSMEFEIEPNRWTPGKVRYVPKK